MASALMSEHLLGFPICEVQPFDTLGTYSSLMIFHNQKKISLLIIEHKYLQTWKLKNSIS